MIYTPAAKRLMHRMAAGVFFGVCRIHTEVEIETFAQRTIM